MNSAVPFITAALAIVIGLLALSGCGGPPSIDPAITPLLHELLK